MWGAKIWQRRDLVEGLMRALIVSGQQQLKSQDQFSLADIRALVSFPGSGNTWLRMLLMGVTGFYVDTIYPGDELFNSKGKFTFKCENYSFLYCPFVTLNSWEQLRVEEGLQLLPTAENSRSVTLLCPLQHGTCQRIERKTTHPRGGAFPRRRHLGDSQSFQIHFVLSQFRIRWKHGWTGTCAGILSRT